MKARIVRIGNSQGIWIPKSLLELSGISGDVEAQVQRGRILFRSVWHSRAGWEAAFWEMAEHGDDNLLDPSASATTWDAAAWEW